MKNIQKNTSRLLYFALVASMLAGCSTTQMGHPEWDDAYFNTDDKVRATYATRSTPTQQSDGPGTTYPNQYAGNGSINNYTSESSGNGYAEPNTQNINANEASAAYVNPDYKASTGSYSDPNTSGAQSTSSGGTTYITNNYYDSDYYYRSPYQRNAFNSFSNFGFGFGPGISLGFGYNSGWGSWFGPSVGISYGWGSPYLGWNSGWGWNVGWNSGFGSFGCNPWGYNAFYDPFWGFGYNPFFFTPYYGYRPMWGSPYAWGGGWNGNNVVYSENRPQTPRTNNPATNMSGNLNPNQVSRTPTANYVPPTTGGRTRGNNTPDGGGSPVAPDPANPNPGRGNVDPNSSLFRSASGTTPAPYRNTTTPETYNPGPESRPTETFQQTTPDPSVFRSSTPGRTVAPTPQPAPSTPFQSNLDNQPARSRRGSDFFRSDDNSSRRSNDSFFGGGRNNGGGGTNGFGGGNGGGRSGGSFTPPSTGGRRRGN